MYSPVQYLDFDQSLWHRNRGVVHYYTRAFSYKEPGWDEVALWK